MIRVRNIICVSQKKKKMDLEVFIKDEDLELRTPLRSQFSPSDLESSEHEDSENEKVNQEESGRQTNVSVY